MKKLSGDELAKEIGCDAATLKKTCTCCTSAMVQVLIDQSITTTITPRTPDPILSRRR
jgi:hypothetical protein